MSALTAVPEPGLPAVSGKRRTAVPEAPGIAGLLRGPAIFGGAIAAGFFVVLGGWAALAPLQSGAVASGIVSPDSNRRVVQHLEGGIIETVHVREGQEVKRGDPLITLEATRAAATFSGREEQWLRLLVTRARLDAQARMAAEMVLPDEVSGMDNSALAEFASAQIDLFETMQAAQLQQEEIFLSRIGQLNSEIAAVRAQNASLSTQVALLSEELTGKERLLNEQLISRSAVLALQREKAALEGTIAANEGAIARAGQAIEETQLSLVQAREIYRSRIAEEMTRVNNEIAQLDEEMVASGDVLRRTQIVSPVDGVVLNFRNQTTGGVVRPGEAIMDVVPSDDDLIIVARLQPRDIDVVRIGLPAQVTLVPFASRNSLPLDGEVIQVSADSTLDEATRQYFYEIRIRVGLDELAAHSGFYLSAGMPADVTVVTGERTLLQYLLDPFFRSFQTAFVHD